MHTRAYGPICCLLFCAHDWTAKDARAAKSYIRATRMLCDIITTYVLFPVATTLFLILARLMCV